jgi:hypothetical protein
MQWGEHRTRQRKEFGEKHRERLRDRQRIHLHKTRLTQPVRFKKFKPEENLTDFCASLDSPISYDNNTLLHEAIASSEPDPLTALMMKEESEGERKYELYRSHRTQCIPVLKRDMIGLRT